MFHRIDGQGELPAHEIVDPPQDALGGLEDIIDECLQEWSAGANQNLVAIIQDAFEVDRDGKLNTGRILSLRKHKIDDERWTRAMQAIADSIIVSGTKAYVRFLVKDEEGRMVSIPLDLAAL